MVVRIIENPPAEEKVHVVRGKCRICGIELDIDAKMEHRNRCLTCAMKPL